MKGLMSYWGDFAVVVKMSQVTTSCGRPQSDNDDQEFKSVEVEGSSREWLKYDIFIYLFILHLYEMKFLITGVQNRVSIVS